MRSFGEGADSLEQVQGGNSMKVKPENLKPASAAQAQSMGGAGGAPMPSVAEVEAKLRSMSVGQLRCAYLWPHTQAHTRVRVLGISCVLVARSVAGGGGCRFVRLCRERGAGAESRGECRSCTYVCVRVCACVRACGVGPSVSASELLSECTSERVIEWIFRKGH